MIPAPVLQSVITAFREQSRKAGHLAVKVMHETGDDLIATGYAATAGTYEICARALEAVIGEWQVPPTEPTEEVPL